MSGLVSAYLEHFTYAGLLLVLVLCGLGLPVPEDFALLAGGFLAYRGVTEYPLTILVALVGVVAGDNSLFFLGRRFGSSIISYLTLGRPASERRIERLRKFMKRHGHLAIFYARFLAGARALVYITAGSLDVEFSRFIFYDALGAMISVPIVVTLGYVFGRQIQSILGYVGGAERFIGVAIVCAVLFIATRFFLTRERSNDHSHPS